MKTAQIVIKSFKNVKLEIVDILKTLSLKFVKNYNWVMFDVDPIGSWADMDEVKRAESTLSSVKLLSGEEFIELIKNVQTDWGVCFAFRKTVQPSFGVLPSSDPNERYEMQHKLAEIEIRSLDGFMIFVIAKDVSLIGRLKARYKNTGEKY